MEHIVRALRQLQHQPIVEVKTVESSGPMASFKSGTAISIKAAGLNMGDGPTAIQVPQVPFVKARFGSARFAWDRASDSCAFGGTQNIWLIEDEKEKGGLRVGGGLRASAVVSDVSRVVDGRRDLGNSANFNFAYTLDCQAYLKPTESTVLRGKVSYARPFAKARLIEQEPHIFAEEVHGASQFRMKAELEGEGGSAVGVQLSRSTRAAGGLNGLLFAPRAQETTEVYGKWRPAGKEGPVLRAGYQPQSSRFSLSAGIAF